MIPKQEIGQQHHYAIKILSQIQLMFSEDSENYISMDDFNNDQNLKDFLHALSNVAPTSFYNKIAGAESNMLEFNHIANQLCFEYMSDNN